MVLSICKYISNKLTYEHIHVKLSEDEISFTLNDSKILVLVDEYYEPKNFVSKKCFKYFNGEKYNDDKTTFLLWSFSNHSNVINVDNICKKLPPNIKYVKFNSYYNNEPKYLPCSITHIFFGTFFNSSVDCLQFSIEYLHFGTEFNNPIDNLPGNLKKIIFVPNSKFNQSLDNLPNFLEYLFLPSSYSKRIDNLPNFLIRIDIHSHYEHDLNNLPNSIEKISFYSFYKYEINKSSSTSINSVGMYYDPDEKIGNDIKIYNIDKIFGKLPQNLKYLDLTFSYKLNLFSDFVSYQIINKNIHVKKDSIKKSQPLDNLPDGLRVLKFPANYNLIQIDKIPQNIVKLYLSNTFNQSIDKLLNPNFGTSKPKPQTKLTHLVFGCKFNCTVNHLPDSLQYLYFGHSFNKSVNNLPNSLILISFGYNFNCSVDYLPSNLKHIIFGKNFSQPINNLKYGIKSITFDYYYSCHIDKLPYGLEKIYLPKSKKILYPFDKYENLIEYY